MSIKSTIIDIIEETLHDDTIHELLQTENDLTSLNLNSISFIKLVINMENRFNIEFDDNQLKFANFTSLDNICDYVQSLIEKNENAF